MGGVWYPGGHVGHLRFGLDVGWGSWLLWVQCSLRSLVGLGLVLMGAREHDRFGVSNGCWSLSISPFFLPRDSVDLRLEELKPFIPPAWMTEKMQKHMETLRRGGDVPPPEEPPEP